MSDTIGPVTPKERVEILDVLRGFAVCGILLGNMQWFSGYGMMPPALARQGATADQVTHFLVHFFIEGKFYSIFSFLFGFGFALQIARAEERADLTATVFKRRLFWLLIIGLLHAYLLWAGDILSVYAATGFVLILFRKKTNHSLLKWVFWLLVIPVLVYVLLYVLFVTFAPREASVVPDYARHVEGWNAQVRAVTESSYWQIISGYNLRYVVGRYAGLIAEMRFTKLLAMFLLGLYAYRRGFFHDLSAHQPFIHRVLVYGLVLGVVGNAMLAVLMGMNAIFPPSALGVVGIIGYAVGVTSLALFYVAAVATLWRKEWARRWLACLAPAGRMALTNYLLQTVVCVLLFYGYGLGLYGSLGATAATLLAVAIFLFQILLSAVWLRYFNYGPAEWIWRQLTYRRRVALRSPPQARGSQRRAEEDSHPR